MESERDRKIRQPEVLSLPLGKGELDLGVLGRQVEVASRRANSLFSMRLALPFRREQFLGPVLLRKGTASKEQG
jgi:hypothetical protein